VAAKALSANGMVSSGSPQRPVHRYNVPPGLGVLSAALSPM
jgi:hypothetical protein